MVGQDYRNPVSYCFSILVKCTRSICDSTAYNGEIETDYHRDPENKQAATNYI